MRACLAAGAAPDDLVYSNPVKRRDHVAESAALGVRIFVVDSPAEVRKVAEAAPGAAVLCRLVTSGDGSDWPLSRKYGCSVGQAVDILRLAAELGLDAAGVSFHVGSQQRDPNAWRSPIAAAATRVRARCAPTGSPRGCSTSAAGSPRGTRATSRRSPPTAPSSRTSCGSRSASTDRGPSSSPGRAVVGDAGALVTSVVGVVERGDTRWVYLDAGVFTGLVETLDEAIRYRIETSADGGPTGPCVLAGPTCDSADVLYQVDPVYAAARPRRGRHRPPRVGRRLHLVLLDRGLQRVRPAAGRRRLTLAGLSWSASSRRAHRPSTESTSSWAIRPGEAVAATTSSPTSSISSRRASSVRSPQSPSHGSNPKE